MFSRKKEYSLPVRVKTHNFNVIPNRAKRSEEFIYPGDIVVNQIPRYTRNDI